MSNINTPYENLLEKIKSEGVHKEDRTGTGTVSLFGQQLRYDLSEGFPLLTTKKVYTKGVIEELLWFLNGDTNARTLQDNDVHIWDEWAEENGNLGPIYGNQWRKWYGYSDKVEQIKIPSDSYEEYSDENIPEEPQIAGVGYFDEEMDLEEAHSKIFRLWQLMIWTCYDEEFIGYNGGEITVSPFWLNYENFKKTIHLVPGYYHWDTNSTFILDATYFASGVYSPDTTIFLSRENISNINNNGNAIEVNGVLYENIEQWDAVYGRTLQQHVSDGKEFRGINQEDVKVLNPEPGYVYRRVFVHDQIQNLVDTLKENPNSRRMIVSAWNVSDIDSMALPACHIAFQVYVANGKLSLAVNQRSADMFLGVPFNIASYALLTHILAQQTGFEVGELIWNGGDVHVYLNHANQVDEQLSREPREYPILKLNKAENIFSYTIDDIEFEGYDPHPTIEAEVSV